LATNKANSWESIKVLGAALLIGRNRAMRAAGVDVPHGRRFSIALRSWMKDNGLGTMPDGTRKCIVILTCPENIAAVTAWRNALPEHERNGMANAQHIYRRWQASLKNGHGKCLAYVKRDAITAWRKFKSCVAALPPEQAAAVWQATLAEVAAMAASAKDVSLGCIPHVADVMAVLPNKVRTIEHGI
jgi:hypothetical protein